jgi:RNA polymerase sigma-70 factor (ECF subfamily)
MHQDGETDESLMLRYGRGDVTAFDTLYRRHRGPVFRFLARQVRHGGAAEELSQDVWMGVIRARSRYRSDARFTTWLYTIARNRLIDHHRAGERLTRGLGQPTDTAPEDLASGLPGAGRVLDAGHALSRLLELVAALPAEQREAFLLREEGGLDVAEIAQVTGVGHETAKSRLRYAVTKLRSDMQLDR